MIGGRRHLQRAAFTLVELIAAILLVLILAVLLVPNYQPIVTSAQGIICASQMRSIRVALDGYLQDHKMVWPQGPAPQEPGWAQFWLSTLEPYDIPERTWQCPTIRGMIATGRAPLDPNLKLHYVPTMFDATPNIAYRWSTQPWLIEMADAHGKGPLICFPDGSVKPFSKVLAEQGVR
jgi:type II secretory pathway pseudopilin PulG